MVLFIIDINDFSIPRNHELVMLRWKDKCFDWFHHRRWFIFIVDRILYQTLNTIFFLLVCLIMHSIIVIISGSTPSYSCQNGKSRMYVPQRVVIGGLQFQILQILSSLDKQYLLPIQDFRSHLMVYLYIIYSSKQ